MAFCEHLDIYETQYLKTEAAYQQINHLVKRISDEGADKGLVDLLLKTLAEWQADNRRLRDDFCALVEAEEVNLPARVKGRPCCAACGFKIPKLQYKEWVIAHNGVAALNGEELMAPQPV